MEQNKPAKIAGILLAYPIAFAYLKYFFLDFTEEYVTLKKLLFVLGFIIFNELVVRGRGKTPPKSVYFWYGIMGIVASTFETGVSEVVSFLGLHLCAFYVAIVSNRLWCEGRTGSFIAADLFNAGVIKAFSGFPKIFSDIAYLGKTSAKKRVQEQEETGAAPLPKKQSGSAVGAVIIVLVMLPIFLVAVSLLKEINPQFGSAIDGFFKNFNFKIDFWWWANNIIYFIMAVPTSLYLYGMLAKSADSDGSGEKKTYGSLIKWRQSCRKISPYVSTVITGLFVLLYLVFFVFEASYLFSAFAGRLPEEFTAAEYARRGFFELTGIMFINMLVFLLISYFEKRDLPGRKGSVAMIIALMAESVVFASVSFSKLALYYSRFGYTPKRLLAIWGTLIFAAGAVLVIASLAKKKDMSRAWIYFTTVSFAVMSVVSTALYLALGGVE